MVESKRIRNVALRGASMRLPPDTIPAVLGGIEDGATDTLVDVRSTRDGIPVLAPDRKLEKFSNGSGNVGKRNFQRIAELDAGVKFGSEFAGTRIPSLEELFGEAPLDHPIWLHQQDTTLRPGYFQNIQQLCAGRVVAGGELTVVVNDSSQVDAVRGWGIDGLRVILMLSEKVNGWVVLQKAERLGLNAVIPHRKQVDTVLVREASRNGLEVAVYFANTEEDMRELVDMGVYAIVTGRPEMLAKALEEEGTSS